MSKTKNILISSLCICAIVGCTVFFSYSPNDGSSSGGDNGKQNSVSSNSKCKEKVKDEPCLKNNELDTPANLNSKEPEKEDTKDIKNNDKCNEEPNTISDKKQEIKNVSSEKVKEKEDLIRNEQNYCNLNDVKRDAAVNVNNVNEKNKIENQTPSSEDINSISQKNINLKEKETTKSQSDNTTREKQYLKSEQKPHLHSHPGHNHQGKCACEDEHHGHSQPEQKTHNHSHPGHNHQGKCACEDEHHGHSHPGQKTHNHSHPGHNHSHPGHNHQGNTNGSGQKAHAHFYNVHNHQGNTNGRGHNHQGKCECGDEHPGHNHSHPGHNHSHPGHNYQKNTTNRGRNYAQFNQGHENWSNAQCGSNFNSYNSANVRMPNYQQNGNFCFLNSNGYGKNGVNPRINTIKKQMNQIRVSWDKMKDHNKNVEELTLMKFFISAIMLSLIDCTFLSSNIITGIKDNSEFIASPFFNDKFIKKVSVDCEGNVSNYLFGYQEWNIDNILNFPHIIRDDKMIFEADEFQKTIMTNNQEFVYDVIEKSLSSFDEMVINMVSEKTIWVDDFIQVSPIEYICGKVITDLIYN